MDSFTYLINGALWIILCLPLLEAFTKTIELIKLVRRKTNNALLSNQSFVTLENLHNLSKKEFMMWCCYFLSKQGYKDVSLVHSGQNNGDLIISTKDNEKTCIRAIRAVDYKTPEFKINNECINQLVGIMIKEKIYSGLIITTGKADESLNTYLSSFPPLYSLNIIDGDMLISKYESLNTILLAPQ